MIRKELQQEREEWRRQEYRRVIIQAAEHVIARKGFGAMTMDDIAVEAQVSKATLYHYVRSKGELMLEILGNFFDEIDQQVQKIKLQKASAKEKLKQGIYYYLEFNKQKENISRMLMMDRSFMEKMRIFVGDEQNLASEADRRFLNRIRIKRKEILDGVASILREGMENGEYRKMDLAAAVLFLEAVLQGYCHVRVWLDDQYSPEKTTELIYHFFLQGIEKRDAKVKGESR
jgi:AcrR family transcriptional regulator